MQNETRIEMCWVDMYIFLTFVRLIRIVNK